MANPNAAGNGNFDPTSDTLDRATMVRYRAETNNPRDDFLALQCNTSGDIVRLAVTPGDSGPAELNSYGNVGKDGSGMAWIATSSGNRYGIAQGQVLNLKTGELSRIDDAEVDIRVNGQVRIRSGDGQVVTSDVAGVLLWQGQADTYGGTRDIDGADVRVGGKTDATPFEQLWKITSYAAIGNAESAAVAIRDMQQQRGVATSAQG